MNHGLAPLGGSPRTAGSFCAVIHPEALDDASVTANGDHMASEVPREKVYGNFKVRGPKEPHKNSKWRDDRAGMDGKHLALIRQLPCCVTRRQPGGEAHHLKSGTGERGMSVRSTDKWAVPIAHDAHMDVERAGTKRERQWFLDRG